MDELYKCMYGIFADHVLEPYCSDPIRLIKLPTQKLQTMFWNLIGCLKLVKRCILARLQTPQGTIIEWKRCSDLNFTRKVYDVRPYHQNLSNKGYRSLYVGIHMSVYPEKKLLLFRSNTMKMRGVNGEDGDDGTTK
ncbi:hypothetical protein Hanom_Chr14g01307101 [Helianthus anomalus]